MYFLRHSVHDLQHEYIECRSAGVLLLLASVSGQDQVSQPVSRRL